MKQLCKAVLMLSALAATFGSATTALAAPPQASGREAATQAVLDYVRDQKTTGFIVIQNGKLLVERNWPLSTDASPFKANFTYGVNNAGELLEDIASEQKSIVSMLAAIAVDKGLLNVQKPVSDYIGAGWSKASPEQEAKIRVIDVLTMSSGLTVDFGYAAAPGTVFLYNTPVYAVSKRVLAAAAHQPLEDLTQAWLTGPAGMTDTSWRKRPASFGDVGNPTGLVTSPRDMAKFGQIVLDGGRTADGKQIVSQAGLAAMFTRSATNPAYGRLWWLNGSAYVVRPLARRVEGPLIPSAPADTVAALGALDRKLYISPAHKLVVVRLGQAASDQQFDEHLWVLLAKAVD